MLRRKLGRRDRDVLDTAEEGSEAISSPVLVPGDSGTLAFGLEWSVLTGIGIDDQIIKETTEIRLNAKALKAQRIVHIENESTSVVGLFVGKPPKKGTTYSAAAVVAHNLKVQNALFFYALPGRENRYALIGIRNRVPWPRFDIVGTKAEVIAAGKRFISRAGQEGIQTYFDGDFDSDFDIREFSPNSKWHPFGDHVLDSAKLVPLPNEGKKIVAGAVFLGALGAAYFGVSTYLEEQARIERAAKRTDPMQAYQQSLGALLAAEFTHTAAVDATRYVAAVSHLPTKLEPHRSWKMQEILCSSSSCSVVWERVSGQNTWLKMQRENETVAFADDLKSATEQVAVSDAETAVPDSSSFPTHQDFKLKTGSMLQLFMKVGIQVTLASPAIAGTWPTGAPPAGSLIVKRGAWNLSGPLQFHDALYDLPNNMSLSNFAIKFNDTQATFHAEGYFYVR